MCPHKLHPLPMFPTYPSEFPLKPFNLNFPYFLRFQSPFHPTPCSKMPIFDLRGPTTESALEILVYPITREYITRSKASPDKPRKYLRERDIHDIASIREENLQNAHLLNKRLTCKQRHTDVFNAAVFNTAGGLNDIHRLRVLIQSLYQGQLDCIAVCEPGPLGVEARKELRLANITLVGIPENISAILLVRSGFKINLTKISKCKRYAFASIASTNGKSIGIAAGYLPTALDFMTKPSAMAAFAGYIEFLNSCTQHTDALVCLQDENSTKWGSRIQFRKDSKGLSKRVVKSPSNGILHNKLQAAGFRKCVNENFSRFKLMKNGKNQRGFNALLTASALDTIRITDNVECIEEEVLINSKQLGYFNDFIKRKPKGYAHDLSLDIFKTDHAMVTARLKFFFKILDDDSSPKKRQLAYRHSLVDISAKKLNVMASKACNLIGTTSKMDDVIQAFHESLKSYKMVSSRPKKHLLVRNVVIRKWAQACRRVIQGGVFPYSRNKHKKQFDIIEMHTCSFPVSPPKLPKEAKELLTKINQGKRDHIFGNRLGNDFQPLPKRMDKNTFLREYDKCTIKKAIPNIVEEVISDGKVKTKVFSDKENMKRVITAHYDKLYGKHIPSPPVGLSDKYPPLDHVHLHDHAEILQAIYKRVLKEPKNEVQKEFDEALIEPYSAAEVYAAFGEMNSSCAVSRDRIPPSFLSLLHQHCSPDHPIFAKLASIFSAERKKSCMPDAWVTEDGQILIKNQDAPNTTGNQRIISTLHLFRKTVESMDYNRIVKLWSKHKMIVKTQVGATTGLSSANNINLLDNIFDHAVDSCQQLIAQFFDLKKCYPMVDYKFLQEALAAVGVPHWWSSYYVESFRKSIVRISNGEELLAEIKRLRGIPEGAVTSCIFITAIMNVLHRAAEILATKYKGAVGFPINGETVVSAGVIDDSMFMATKVSGANILNSSYKFFLFLANQQESVHKREVLANVPDCLDHIVVDGIWYSRERLRHCASFAKCAKYLGVQVGFDRALRMRARQSHLLKVFAGVNNRNRLLAPTPVQRAWIYNSIVAGKISYFGNFIPLSANFTDQLAKRHVSLVKTYPFVQRNNRHDVHSHITGTDNPLSILVATQMMYFSESVNRKDLYGRIASFVQAKDGHRPVGSIRFQKDQLTRFKFAVDPNPYFGSNLRGLPGFGGGGQCITASDGSGAEGKASFGIVSLDAKSVEIDENWYPTDSVNWDDADRQEIVSSFNSIHGTFKHDCTTSSPSVHAAEAWALTVSLLLASPNSLSLCDSTSAITNASTCQNKSVRKWFRSASRQAAKCASLIYSERTSGVHKIKSHDDGLSFPQLVHSLADFAAEQDSDQFTDRTIQIGARHLMCGEGKWLPTINGKLIIIDLVKACKQEMRNRTAKAWSSKDKVAKLIDKSSLMASRQWFQIMNTAVDVLPNFQYLLLSATASNTLNTVIMYKRVASKTQEIFPTACACGKGDDSLLHNFLCVRHRGYVRRIIRKMLITVFKISKNKDVEIFKALATVTMKAIKTMNYTPIVAIFTCHHNDVFDLWASQLDLTWKRFIRAVLPVVGEAHQEIYNRNKGWRPPPAHYSLLSQNVKKKSLNFMNKLHDDAKLRLWDQPSAEAKLQAQDEKVMLEEFG